MSKLWIEDNEVIPAVVYQTIDPSIGANTYSEATIEQWAQYGESQLQFMHTRSNIQVLVATKSAMFTNWGALTSEEQIIAVQWICAPYALRVPFITDNEDKENWNYMVQKLRGVGTIDTLEGREYISELLRERVSDEVRREVWDNDTSNSFYYDTERLLGAYRFANAQDLIAWISNKVGTPFENDGFAEKSYYTNDLKEDLVLIYNSSY